MFSGALSLFFFLRGGGTPNWIGLARLNEEQPAAPPVGVASWLKRN